MLDKPMNFNNRRPRSEQRDELSPANPTFLLFFRQRDEKERVRERESGGLRWNFKAILRGEEIRERPRACL